MQLASIASRVTAAALALGVLLDPQVSSPAHAGPAHDGGKAWDGFYAGGYVGGAWGDADTSASATCGPFIPYYFHCGNQARVEASGTGSSSDRSFSGGVKAGYDWRQGHTVFGGVVDFGSLDLDLDRTSTSAYAAAAPGVPFRTTTALDTDWLLTARARLGWAVAPDLLVYATGGLAVTKIHTTLHFSDDNGRFRGSGSGSNSETKTGWTIGAGAEWQLARNWSLQAEYLYADFGSVSTSAGVLTPAFPAATSTLTTTTDLDVQTVRIGINYYFGN